MHHRSSVGKVVTAGVKFCSSIKVIQQYGVVDSLSSVMQQGISS